MRGLPPPLRDIPDVKMKPTSGLWRRGPGTGSRGGKGGATDSWEPRVRVENRPPGGRGIPDYAHTPLPSLSEHKKRKARKTNGPHAQNVPTDGG